MRDVKKRTIKNLVLLVLIMSVTYNFYMYLKYNNTMHQKQSQNQTDLKTISANGNNLAERLEDFLDNSDRVDSEEIQGVLFNSWRIVISESQSIHFFLGRVSPQDMKQFDRKWSLLQYSLIRIDEFLLGLNIKFLDQGNYSVNNEETEKIKAVVTIYRKIHEEINNKSDNPVLVIDALTEQMKIIDQYYPATLETIGHE